MITFNDLKEYEYIKYTYNSENVTYISEVLSVTEDTLELNDIYCSVSFNRGFGKWVMYEHDIEDNYINIEVYSSKDDIIEYLI